VNSSDGSDHNKKSYSTQRYEKCHNVTLLSGADLRQKASSTTLPGKPALPSLLLPTLLSHPLPSPLPLEVGPSNPTRGSGGALHVSSPSGVWGEAPAEIEFGAF